MFHLSQVLNMTRLCCYIMSQLWLAGGFYTILLKFPLAMSVMGDVIFDTA